MTDHVQRKVEESPAWKEFPRLYDLYMGSDRNNQSNYFEHPNCINALERRDNQLATIENTLRQMDDIAWKAFKVKTVRLVSINDKWGWNSDLFDRFDEATAYRYLLEEGYSEIEFVPEDQNQRTPDLWGKRADGSVLLEVKTIRESDDENNYMTGRENYREEKDARQVEPFINDAMKRKLSRTIHNAAVQLNYSAREVNRRILFLSVRLDLKCATKHTVEDLRLFLQAIQLTDIEITHVVKNSLFL